MGIATAVPPLPQRIPCPRKCTVPADIERTMRDKVDTGKGTKRRARREGHDAKGTTPGYDPSNTPMPKRRTTRPTSKLLCLMGEVPKPEAPGGDWAMPYDVAAMLRRSRSGGGA